MAAKAEQERLLKEAVLAMKGGMGLTAAAKLYKVQDVKKLELHHAAHKQGTLLYWIGFAIVLLAFSLRTKIFVSVISNVVLAHPVARKLMWRATFDYISLVFRDETLFMNYGYLPDEKSPFELYPTSELSRDQNNANLVSAVLATAKVQGKTGLAALEIGSGRGGGARFVMQNFPLHIASLTAVDFSTTAVQLCRERHADVSGLTFVHGDAERLPLPSESFDLVINIESSHCYSNVPAFVSEAYRVLRPGGTFCVTDFRAADKMENFLRELRNQTWASTVDLDITNGVLAALTEDDDRKRLAIASRTPYLLRSLFEEFAGLRGGMVFTGLGERKILYTIFCAEKSSRRDKEEGEE